MRSIPLLLGSLLALGGCFGGDLFANDTRLEDSFYTFGAPPIRGSYALGSPVDFTPDFADEDVGANTETEVLGDGLTVIRTDGPTVFTEADAIGSGEVVFRLRGEQISRTSYRVQAADRFQYRWVFDMFGREDLEGVDFIVPIGRQAEVVVDYYAGDTRLYGREVSTAGDGGTVEATRNNDRLVIDTSLAGPQSVELTAVGGGTDTFEYEVVDAIAAITIERTDGDDNISLRAVITDARGRVVRSPVEWNIEGRDPFQSTSVSFPRGSTTRTVTATLLGALGTIDVPVDPT